MDRTAWIAVVLCTIGLVSWYAYMAKQAQPQHSNTANAPGAVSPTPFALASASAPPVVTPTPVATPSQTATVPPFALKTETLSNGDVELHFTNRGGGISEEVLCHNTQAQHQI